MRTPEKKLVVEDLTQSLQGVADRGLGKAQPRRHDGELAVLHGFRKNEQKREVDLPQFRFVKLRHSAISIATAHSVYIIDRVI
jgi:hypothetical protein